MGVLSWIAVVMLTVSALSWAASLYHALRARHYRRMLRGTIYDDGQ